MSKETVYNLDNNGDILTEVTPLSECDFLYVVDRTKDSFTFPVHRHAEFEINFVENCAGARRIVGDSIAPHADAVGQDAA